MQKTWEQYMEPFQIFGNLYFVGAKCVSTHVIDTGDGLILIDSNFPECTYLITEGMRKLGLDPMNIKYILHSHGHLDHTGGTRALVELTGAKTIIGKEDVLMASGRGEQDLSWSKELGYGPLIHTFEPDIIVDDGDTFTLGNTTIRFISTPGHTDGTMSFVFNVSDGKDTYTAGMFGGAGVLTMSETFLQEYNLPLTVRDDFVNSIERMRKEKIDILIGNHPGDVQTASKWEIMKKEGTNPFIDPTALEGRLEYILNQFNEMVEKRGKHEEYCKIYMQQKRLYD